MYTFPIMNGPTKYGSLGYEHGTIISSFITEYSSRLSCEISTRTEDIASKVVDMVKRKLRSTAAGYVFTE